MLAKDATSIEPAPGRVTRAEQKRRDDEAEKERSRKGRVLEGMAMEVAADDDQPFPAPYRKTNWWGSAMKQIKQAKQ